VTPDLQPSEPATKRSAIAALALAAASAGVIVPALRALVEQSGHGATAASLFSAAHAMGGIVGAACGARALRWTGSPRRLAAGSLAASIALMLVIAAVDSLALRVGLRLADGVCHVLAITALAASATSGDPVRRARRVVLTGLAIVLGIAGGLGIGAALTRPEVGRAIAALGRPEAVLLVAAALSGAALITALAGLTGLTGLTAAGAAREPSSAALAARPVGAALAARPVGAALAGLTAAGAAREPSSAALAARPVGAASAAAPDALANSRAAIAPSLLAFSERFLFGTLTVATPFLAPGPRVGAVLGVFMTASVVALPVARRYALRLGPRWLAIRSAVVFAVALAPYAVTNLLASLGPALIWAVVCGGAAGSLYASALVLAARSAALEGRVRDMGALHAAGNTGHTLGALCAGPLLQLLPGAMVIAVPGAIVAAAAVSVWFTVPAGIPANLRDAPDAPDARGASGPARPELADQASDDATELAHHPIV
jgi:hypothetical protein